MDKKIEFTATNGGEVDLIYGDILRTPDANRDGLFGFMDGLVSSSAKCIVQGCGFTPSSGSGSTATVAAGYYWFGNELIQVDAQTKIETQGTDIWELVRTVTYDSGGYKTYTDTTTQQTWQKVRGVLTNVAGLTTNFDIAGAESFSEKFVAHIQASSADTIALVEEDRIITPKRLGEVTGGLLTKVLNIGTWDMDSSSSVTVVHGVTMTKIRSIDVVIYNDALSRMDELDAYDVLDGMVSGLVYVGSTNVSLWRRGAGMFDATAYATTPTIDGTVTRGFVVIQYEA